MSCYKPQIFRILHFWWCLSVEHRKIKLGRFHHLPLWHWLTFHCTARYGLGWERDIWRDTDVIIWSIVMIVTISKQTSAGSNRLIHYLLNGQCLRAFNRVHINYKIFPIFVTDYQCMQTIFQKYNSWILRLTRKYCKNKDGVSADVIHCWTHAINEIIDNHAIIFYKQLMNNYGVLKADHCIGQII